MSRRRWSAILLSCASRQRDDVERQIRGIVNTESGDVNAPRSATTFIGQFPPNQLRKRVFEDSTGNIVFSRARTIADPVEPVCSGGVDRAKRAAPRPPRRSSARVRRTWRSSSPRPADGGEDGGTVRGPAVSPTLVLRRGSGRNSRLPPLPVADDRRPRRRAADCWLTRAAAARAGSGTTVPGPAREGLDGRDPLAGRGRTARKPRSRLARRARPRRG